MRRIVCAIALILTGCVNAPRPTAQLWHTLSGRQEQALLRLVDAWNAARPDVYIIPRRRDPNAQHTAVLDAGKTGALPELMVVTPQQAVAYQRLQLLRPLDGYAYSAAPEVGFKPNDLADFFPFVLSAGKDAQGQLLGLPLGGEVRILLVNTGWLDARGLLQPASLELLTKICEEAAKPENGLPCLGAVADNALMQEWPAAHGARIIDADGAARLNAPEVRAAIDQLLRQPTLIGASDTQLRAEFVQERLLLLLDWSGNLRTLDQQARERADFQWEVMPLPGAGDAPTAIQRAPLLVMPRTSAERERRAWAFVRWLFAQEQTAQWAMLTDELPARVSAVGSIDAARVPAGYLKLLTAVAPRAQAEPLTLTWPCARDALDGGAQRLFVFGLDPLTTTLDALQTGVSAALQGECALR